MNWIVASLLMFFSSVALYLFIRKSSLLKISSQLNNLAMFFIPLFAFVFMGIITHQSFILSFNQFVIIIFGSFVFSYLGNRFSLLSIEYAPNPGYSLVISKSYVVFTSLVSVMLFHSELSMKNIIAIISIVGFSALIMLSKVKNTNNKINQLWLPLSIGAFFCWGMLSLMSKYLFNQGVNLYVLLSYVYLIVSICILFEILKKKISIKPLKEHSLIILLIGLFALGFNWFQFYAIKIAPNVGYVNAINAASISLVTICAAIFFKDELSLKKFIGVLGVTAGLFLLLV